ncbi:MAG: hypothetical protein E7385_04805 [Ruminococcaceae bacterium]|nr:hypothetical protein [Oscillospiraceae bacterium]
MTNKAIKNVIRFTFVLVISICVLLPGHVTLGRYRSSFSENAMYTVQKISNYYIYDESGANTTDIKWNSESSSVDFILSNSSDADGYVPAIDDIYLKIRVIVPDTSDIGTDSSGSIEMTLKTSQTSSKLYTAQAHYLSVNSPFYNECIDYYKQLGIDDYNGFWVYCFYDSAGSDDDLRWLLLGGIQSELTATLTIYDNNIMTDKLWIDISEVHAQKRGAIL